MNSNSQVINFLTFSLVLQHYFSQSMFDEIFITMHCISYIIIYAFAYSIGVRNSMSFVAGSEV